MYKKVEAEIGGRILSIESGKVARQANGSVWVTYGETVVLVTATAAKETKQDMGFLPLTIEYQERLYSAAFREVFSGVKSAGPPKRKPFPPGLLTGRCAPCFRMDT